MKTAALNQLKKPAVQQHAAHLARRHLDLPLGFALLKDKRVPLGKKFLSFLLGGGATALLLAIEVPLELLAMVLAVPLGIIDGLELLLLPTALACGILPRLIPVELADQIRAERATRV